MTSRFAEGLVIKRCQLIGRHNYGVRKPFCYHLGFAGGKSLNGRRHALAGEAGFIYIRADGEEAEPQLRQQLLAIERGRGKDDLKGHDIGVSRHASVPKGAFIGFFFDSGRPSQYYCAPMSEGTRIKQLPRTVEPRKLAHLGVFLEGRVGSDDFKRLADATLAIKDVQAELHFGLDYERRPQVRGRISGSVVRQCQRCLNPLDLDIGGDFFVGIVGNEKQAKALPGDVEPWLVEEDSADLFHMLEDEILLGMPYVSYHEHECVDPAYFRSEHSAEETPVRANPFQVLEQLRSKK